MTRYQARNLLPWEANFAAPEVRAALDDGAAPARGAAARIAGNTLLSQQDSLQGLSENLLGGRRTSRQLLSELEPAGMAKHVRMDREWHLGGLPEALDEPVETDGADWSAALGNEYMGICWVIAP